MQPILEFKSNEELQESLKEWQKRLFLDDWVIKAELVNRSELVIEGEELNGSNTFQMVNKASAIRIAVPDDDIRDRIIRYCAEHILVHELLHCKYNWLESDYSSMSNAYYDTQDHALLEQMAKSLIMAKYNIDLDWFINFGKSDIPKE